MKLTEEELRAKIADMPHAVLVEALMQVCGGCEFYGFHRETGSCTSMKFLKMSDKGYGMTATTASCIPFRDAKELFRIVKLFS